MSSNIQYKELLPTNMRETRWGELIQMFQNIMDEEFRPNKVELIKNQFVISEMNTSEILSLAYTFGFNLSTFTGYTASEDYLKKEILSIISRIKNKTNRTSYRYIFYIFNLNGEIYPMIKNYTATLLEPIEYWWTSNENPLIIENLDSSDDNLLYQVPYYIDTGLSTLDIGLLDSQIPVYDTPKNNGLEEAYLDDDVIFPTIDLTSFLKDMTRHYLISYSHKFIENETEFLSLNTNKAFYNDVIQNKRMVEIPYFETILNIEANLDTTLNTKTYYNYDQTISADMKSIYNGVDIASNALVIRFGIGAHTVIDGTIVDVETFSFEKSIENFTIIKQSSTEYHIRYTMSPLCKFSEFTEIAIQDSLGNCLMYSTFPKIIWYDEMNSNIYIKINLV